MSQLTVPTCRISIMLVNYYQGSTVMSQIQQISWVHLRVEQQPT